MNNDNSWVADLKPGDVVMLSNVYMSGDQFIGVVSRVTEKRVYARRKDEDKYHLEYEFNRGDGQVIPRIYHIKLSPLIEKELERYEMERARKTEEDKIKAKRRSLIQSIRAVHLESLGIDQLERINDFIAMIEMKEHV